MSGSLVTAMIAGGSAIAGGGIVAGSNYLISRRNAGDVRQAGLREMLEALISALSQVDHELRSEPRSKRIVRVVNEQMETRFPQVDYITGRIHRRLFQPGLDGLIVRLHDAMAAALLAAPPELIEALETTSTVMSGVDQNSDEWWASWDDARAELVRASRGVLGEAIQAAHDSVSA